MSGLQLDPQVQAVLDAVGDMPLIDLAALPLAEAMRIARPVLPAPAPPQNSADRYLPLAGGGELRLRLYYPESAGSERPALLYLHGGGFVGGTVEMDDPRCARLAELAGCVVASLDYRLAPEYPFPTAIHDAHAAWQWLRQQAAGLGLDSQRFALCGSSAGGHIALGLTRLLLQRRERAPRYLLLVNPALDPQMACASYTAFKTGPFMTAARMAWYWQQYRGAADPGADELWSPLQADLRGFPPTHVMTAEYDVLRDEGELLVEQLQAAGVAATATRYAGMIHGFMTVLPGHTASLAAMAESARLLAVHLAGRG